VSAPVADRAPLPQRVSPDGTRPALGVDSDPAAARPAWRHRDQRDAETATLQVSVVVPTYHRPALLRRCLAALLRQDIDPERYEILVADDAASDQTRRQVEALAEALCPCQTGRGGPAIRYVAVRDRHGPAAARNAGWRLARAPIVAFTDDDCVPQPGWLRAGLAALSDGVIGAWGRTIVPLPDHPTDYERDAAGLEDGVFLTANCFYRRDALDVVGGFDERFTAPWREDSDLFFSLLERVAPNDKPGPFVQALDAVVVHPVRPAPWGVSLSQQRKSMFNALLYKKHPRLYRERIQPAPPWRYYASVAALLLALLALLSGSRRGALAGASLWLWLTGRFCAQRLRDTSRDPRHVAEMLVTSALIPPLSIYWRLRGAVTFRVVFL